MVYKNSRADVVRAGAIDIPGDAPDWITTEYVAQCMENTEVQKNWKPKVGDWYFCSDLYRVAEITDLRGYFYDPAPGTPGTLPSDCHLGSDGRWPCDTYIPKPKKSRKGTKKS
jgi:hypothetical protein